MSGLMSDAKKMESSQGGGDKAGGGGGDQAGAGGASSGYEGKVNSGKSCFFFPAPSRRERRTLLTHSQLPTALCTRRAFLSRRIAPSTRRSMGR